MEVYNLKTMKREESVCSPLSAALGNFDGVHIGHAELISRTVKYAKENGCASAVWTFKGSAGVLPNKPDARCITDTEEKLELMASLGVDYAILEDFEKVRGLSAESFVKELLVDSLNVRCAVCGYNFKFGAGGKASADDLQRLMYPHHCIIVPQVFAGNTPVSSTAIRRLIENGDMEGARELLGHPFSISAPVAKGKQLGRTIGIPTVNQYFKSGHVVPKKGIYACRVTVNGKSFIGVSNVGIRPTIENDDHRFNCETHILDFNGCIYGETVNISFYSRLRDELRFGDVEALRRQIELDVQKARQYFDNEQIGD